MYEIGEHIQQIQQQLNRQDVTILAVSKTQSLEKIKIAYDAGIRHFAENYLQEALEKIPKLETLNCTWHFIGSIQSKKVAKICQYFDWVQTIDRIELVKLFAKNCEHLDKKLNVCIQVSLFNESQKSGISVDDLGALIQEILRFPNLVLRGLMTILPQELNASQQLQAYQTLARLKELLNDKYHLSMDTLSMGMSTDYMQAVAAGASMIRLGQIIFGARA
jgi:pyridoxal phosphate enzyme (YggS family)